MSSDQKIYTGFWVNHSKDAIFGSTLTLQERNGIILIAAIAIFIQLIGVQSWGIMRFITYQMRSTSQARDCLFHQQQAILRNDGSDINTVWMFARIAHAWRKRSPNTFWKSITLILIGTVHLIAFGAASVLASHITTSDSQVLVNRSPYCGPWSQITATNSSVLTEGIPFVTYKDTTMQSSDKYVQDCLSQNQALPECNVFKQRKLHWTSTTNNPCRFGDLCLGSGNDSLHLDTGLIDSREDLGINGKDEDRVQWRKNTTCIPIKTDGYSKRGTSSINYKIFNSAGHIDFNYTALLYGSGAVDLNVTGISDPLLRKSTFVYTNYYDSSIYTRGSPYDVMSLLAVPGYEKNYSVQFYPIPELAVPETTVTLAFASLHAGYSEPSDDLWLAAHAEMNGNYNSNLGKIPVTMYLLDNEVSVLACVEQHQVCNPSSNKPNCTPMRPTRYLFQEELGEIFDNPRQVKTANALLTQASYSGIDRLISEVPLLAQRFASRSSSMPIASNQWILEVENWFQIGLTGMQRLMLESVTGPSSDQYLQYIPINQADNDINLAFLCDNQIIQRNDYTNFYTLSICLIFAIGGITYVANQTIENAVGWYRSKRNTGQWRQQAWWAEGTLQLQRRAFEGMGIKGWDSTDWDIPLAQEKRNFSALRAWDEILPVAEEPKGGSIVYVEKQELSASEQSKSTSEFVIVQVNSNVGSSIGGVSASNDGRPRSV